MEVLPRFPYTPTDLVVMSDSEATKLPSGDIRLGSLAAWGGAQIDQILQGGRFHQSSEGGTHIFSMKIKKPPSNVL